MRKNNKITQPQHHVLNKRSKKTGLPPGSLVYIGKDREHLPDVKHIRYNEEIIDEASYTLENIPDTVHFHEGHYTWLNINGVHDTHLVHTIGKKIHIDPLTLEDICNTEQRPKAEIHDNYLFITLKSISFNEQTNMLDSEQFSLILTNHVLLTFREKNDDFYRPIHERLKNSTGKIRQRGLDYLLYCILDMLVDSYFEVIEQLTQQADNLEDIVYASQDQSLMGQIQNQKKMLLQIRRQIFPLRDALNFLLKNSPELINSINEKYYRDVYDHLFHTTESIENLLEMNSSLKDMHLSVINLKMNQIIQILTVFTAIFTPLTFIVGLYGMNFENIPELKWQYGYFGVWGIMILIVTGLLIYLKKKHWLK